MKVEYAHLQRLIQKIEDDTERAYEHKLQGDSQERIGKIGFSLYEKNLEDKIRKVEQETEYFHQKNNQESLLNKRLSIIHTKDYVQSTKVQEDGLTGKNLIKQIQYVNNKLYTLQSQKD